MKTNFASITDTRQSPYALLKPVSITNVQLEEGFWGSRFKINQSITLKAQYEFLESTGRLDNFLRAAGKLDKPYQGLVFNDSDVYKWLEAASWSLVNDHSDEIHHLVDHVISLVSAAQCEDGYLNTYFSLDRATERWTNLREKHELYCAGHLIQAAIAHHRVTAEDSLINIAIRLANHIYDTFGPSRLEGTCGHPEVEMALVELYRTTGDSKYLELARLFLDRRGHGLLGGSEYLIDHIPFRNLERLVGHAVRALYLCSGATDILLESGEEQLLNTIERLWTNMVQGQMYVTGGLGARYEGEAFGEPYELPNARAYAETCAAIASVMWNWRMLQLNGESRYADLLEWTLYNAVLSGISLDGRQYFYVNPLQDHGKSRRQAWFECACCPPNVSRTLAMLPGYLYSLSPGGIWVNLYASSFADFKLSNGLQVGWHLVTSYPWDGHVTIEITSVTTTQALANGSQDELPFSIFLRLPGWITDGNIEVKLNGEPIEYPAHPGSYLEIYSTWQCGDRIDMDLPMKVNFLASHPLVLENTNRIAITRGPMVYCLEAVDHPGTHLAEVAIDCSEQPEVEYLPGLLGGVTQLTVKARIQKNLVNQSWGERLYQPIQQRPNPQDYINSEVKCIPYFAWANRAPGEMQVWHSYY